MASGNAGYAMEHSDHWQKGKLSLHGPGTPDWWDEAGEQGPMSSCAHKQTLNKLSLNVKNKPTSIRRETQETFL